MIVIHFDTFESSTSEGVEGRGVQTKEEIMRSLHEDPHNFKVRTWLNVAVRWKTHSIYPLSHDMGRPVGIACDSYHALA